MVIQKRVVIVLFSFLFILLFSSLFSAANFEGLQLKEDNDDATYKTYDAATENDYGNEGWGWYSGNYCESVGTTGSYDYDLPSFPPSSSGCYIGAVDYDKGDDDCLYAYAKPGYIIYSHKYTKIDASGSTGFGGDGAEDAANFLNWGWLINPGGICADDHYWHPCDYNKDNINQSLEISEPNSKNKNHFYCLQNNKDQYFWIKSSEIRDDQTIDQDEDGVPIFFDCDDKNDQIYPTFPKDCVVLPKDGKLKEGKVECTVPVAAPEIIGNGIDEDCNGKDVLDADESKELCENINNIVKGESYFWMGADVKDGNTKAGCCGDDPKDFGKIFTTNSGERLCLKKDPKSVGSVKKVEEIAANSCKGEWCAPEASSQSSHFHILTIKKPGQEPYDIVSNTQTWKICDQEHQTTDKEFTENIINGDDNLKFAHGFSCYKEGDHWSWVNCKSKASNNQIIERDNGIKDRVEGEGLFSLPLIKKNDKGQSEKSIYLSGTNIPIQIKDLYGTFYNDKSFDLIKPEGKEQYLEAYVRFTPSSKSIIYPATVKLTIKGPKVENKEGKQEYITYFDQSILGYAVNTPLLEPNRWIHVKIPFPTLYDVTSLVFTSSPETNTIEVRNVYLTYGEKPSICSGQASTEQSTWLNDLDYSEEGKEVTGEKLCNVLFDPKFDGNADGKGTAWLGDKVTSKDAQCCGNGVNEYYAGVSTAVGEKTYYGCWNSEPVKANSSVMDVEVSVGYAEDNDKDDYSNEFTWTIAPNPEKSLVSVVCPNGEITSTLDNCNSQENSKFEINLNKKILTTYFEIIQSKGCIEGDVEFYNKNEKVGETYSVVATTNTDKQCKRNYPIPTVGDKHIVIDKIIFKTKDNKQASLKGFTFGFSQLTMFDSTVISSKSKVLLNSHLTYLGEIYFDSIYPEEYSFIVYTNDPNIKVFFTGGNNVLNANGARIYASPKNQVKKEKIQTKDILTFTCTPPSDSSKSSECTYPLPGEPPYTITNPHPELYELYFVSKDDKGTQKETLISTQSAFNTEGNLRVKKLAQQVLFASNGLDANFYGCNAAKYLTGETKVQEKNNKGYCNTAGGKYFCAPSLEIPIGQDKYTIINSWSEEKLIKVGYDLSQEKTFDLKTFTPTLRQIPDNPILAVQRNHSTNALPTRNFIPNAEFATANNKLPSWELLTNNIVTSVEFLSAKDKILTLKDKELLKSERIAIPQNSKLKFTSKSTCQPTLYLVGDSTETIPNPQEFDTKNARYLIIEFKNSCKIEQPFLQLIDDKGPVDKYNYIDQKEISRAGLGCCPDNNCWNGYACVEDMTPFSQFAEHISDGRDYRCIEGIWTSSPLKYDWNGDQWGFCSKDSQCFVRPSEPSDPTKALTQSKFTIKDIYNQNNKATPNIPLCINNKESILDHYCDNGAWTSRTKFIASKLIDIAGDDHYTLYCAPPQTNFVEYDNQEKYIFGGELVKEEPKPKDFNQAPNTKPIQPSCFSFTPEISGKLGLDKEDRCINNVCILKFQESGIQKTAFATTLNKAATDKDSFLNVFNIPSDKVSERCKATDTDKDKFIKCDLSNLDTTGELWYAPSFNAIIYSKEGITTSTSIIDSILTFFKDLFTKTITPDNKLPMKLLTEAKNVKDIYLYRNGNKQVTAITEVKADKKTLIAEYKGFDTPICTYINNLISNDPNIKVQLINQFTGQDKVRCYTTDDNTQRIEAIEGIDFFWPKLTGMLRIEEGK